MACACLWLPHTLAAEASLQLRIAWGGGTERIWQGSIRLSAGRLSDLEPLGVEADEPGSMWLDGPTIEIHQRSVRSYDGVDVVVTADLDAELSITLEAAGDPPKNAVIPLRTLLAQQSEAALDDSGNRLVVTRSPADKLRVKFERENMIFAPGDKFQFELQPFMMDASGAKLRFQAEIVSVPGGQSMFKQEYDSGTEGAASIQLVMPNVEGVYDLNITAVTPQSRLRRNLRNLAPASKAVGERKLQFVVLDERAPAEPGPAPLTKVAEIDPVNPKWSERLGNIPWIPGLRKGPLGNGDAATWQHPKLGPLVRLGPGASGANMSWEAYPLPLNAVGQPHVLEVEYPSDVPQAMGISLIEPNAAGVVMPIGLDSGVYVSEDDADAPARMVKHRVVFWPHTRSPLLLITNRASGRRAVYGKITVLGGAASQFSLPGMARAETGAVSLPPMFNDNERGQRLWAGYMDRPLFTKNFGAPESLEPTSHRSLDDWNTFYQGGQRLTKYLKHVGFNGLMLTVFADGSTIYPSQIVQPTPRYDTGAFFATGQDPQRKDVLELLLRQFDREGLTLIPTLQFASPLPELEVLKREGGPQSVGIEWIGADGKPWLATNSPHQGLAPYYNILDVRVQQVMLKVASELTQRCASHESFGGVALQLSSEGYAQLPGDEWGFDDQTVARFERDTKTRVPGAGPQRFAERAKYLAGPGREAWLQWRAGIVADFHKRLKKEVTSRHQGAKLYLAGGAMFENRQSHYRLRPTLLKRPKLDDALTDLGIKAQTYQDEEGIVLLRPQYLRPPIGALPAQATALEVNMAPEFDRLFGGGDVSGSLFYHEPQKTRLASFDAKSPFGPANTYTWLVSQMSPSSQRNRRRFAHSLATLDSQEMFDGGWLLNLGQEDALREMVSVYRQLPNEHFENVVGEFQPVTVRSFTRDRQTYVYLVNDSPWDVTLTLKIDVPADCKMEKLGESKGIAPLVRTGTETTWKVTLRPYDLTAARFNAARVRVRGGEVNVSDLVRHTLHRKIQDLGARVAALQNPQPTTVVENHGFEGPPQGDQISGWTTNLTAGGSVTLDAGQRRSGTHSVKLAGTGAPVGITSGPFPPPATGRLSVEVWLRAVEAQRPTLKISVQGKMLEGKFEPFGLIQGVGAGASSSGEWVRYSFPIEHLPAEGLSDLRVHLELTGPGEVWVDDVHVYDLAFSEAERKELSKLISLASFKLGKNQFADCSLLLDSYWPQFLVANVPLAATHLPVAQRPSEITTSSSNGLSAPGAAKKATTVLENLKGYLPKLQR